jgi:hypothetical protein
MGSRLKWEMDAKRRRRSLSLADEAEYREKDAASRWLERAEAAKKRQKAERKRRPTRR